MNQNPGQNAVGKGKKNKWFLVVVVAIMLVAIAVISKSCMPSFSTNNILGDKEKVILALSNTVTDSKPMVDFFMKASKLTGEEEYTMSLESTEGKEKSLLTWAHTQNGKQIQYELGSNGETTGKITAQIGKEQVKLVYSNLESSVFCYNYRQENHGYIFTELMKPENVEKFNESLDKIYKLGLKEEYKIAAASIGGVSKDELTIASIGGVSRENLADYLSAYQELEFEKTYNRNYEIDGEEILCQGYKTVITKAFADKFTGGQSLFKENAEVIFYIDDKMVTAIIIKTDESETEISFPGGTYRMQNITVKENGEEVLKLKIDMVTTEEKSLALQGEVWVNEAVLKEKMSFDAWEYFLWVDIEGEDEEVAADGWKDVVFTVQEAAEFEALSGKEIDIGTASIWELGVTLIEIILQSIANEL